jgi:hypothetical protein
MVLLWQLSYYYFKTKETISEKINKKMKKVQVSDNLYWKFIGKVNDL